jgi:ArsR family transcriptional regulator, arsenate/arsenite/antimonite-responsive transcriptional repressor
MYRRNMEIKSAVAAMSALGHPGRIAAYRLLVQAGAAGLPSGDLARQLDIPANTLSGSLGILARTGLVTARRHGRSVIYTADFDAMADLLAWLVGDCCGGAPALCQPLMAVVADAMRCGMARA